ncbi:MAG TPA: CARDB domain-containing protein [Candidatus Paceibacterota bacterium]|nr:CARDB domain-containing protein [Candidatus Paceibacterota bacterium]
MSGVLMALAVPSPAFASVANWQKGANILPANNTDFSSASFEQSLRDLASTGANYVTLDIPLYQSNINSTDVGTGWDTPTDQSLIAGIQYAHSIGLHVMLKLMVSSNDGQWSAYINPSDRTTWFANYDALVLHYAQLGQANGVEELCIGTELISMSSASVNPSNTGNWESLIGQVRKVFSGALTYDSNWGGPGFTQEETQIQFWSALDFIGISGYFNLSGDGSVSALMSSWDSWNQSLIAPLSAQWGKPILFTELGYQSIFDSYTDPWNWGETGSPNVAQQANDYQAFFQYWNQYSNFAGVDIWNWSSDPNAGGSNDSGYTPQNKPAQSVMAQWFGQSAPAAPPGFSATASVTPGTPVEGQNAGLSVNVANSGGAVSGANVDVEIYDSGGTQVFQQVFSGQNFAGGGSGTYPVGWTANAAGAYTVKVGVFSGDWSQEYYWGNQVLAFSVTAPSGGGGGSGSGSTSTIQVWWPTDGVTVTGVQPFKAMLENMSVDNYSMYWQVDGGQLNAMPSNETDYPHKEASVDVSPWNWRGNGPYVVTFVAKDANGQTIGETSVSIFN